MLPPCAPQDFYEDIFEELAKYGELENLNICDNLADHLVGNVYVKFVEEESAAAAVAGLSGRFYAGAARRDRCESPARVGQLQWCKRTHSPLTCASQAS